jgi:hypothetical protein
MLRHLVVGADEAVEALEGACGHMSEEAVHKHLAACLPHLLLHRRREDLGHLLCDVEVREVNAAPKRTDDDFFDVLVVGVLDLANLAVGEHRAGEWRREGVRATWMALQLLWPQTRTCFKPGTCTSAAADGRLSCLKD